MSHSSLKRIFELDRMIHLSQLKSTHQAAENLEVSQRTIERDLETLREHFGAEPKYNRQKGYYEYTANTFPLSAQWLNEREVAILLIAERALRIFTSTSFHDEIHPAFNKLLRPIRDEKKRMEYIIDLCNSVHFHRPVESIRDMRHEFSVVLDAVMQKKRLSILYHWSGKKSNKRRELEPYVLLNNGGEWYVIGRCLITRKEKTFMLSQIRDPQIVDMFFAIPKEFDVEKYLYEGFEKMPGIKLEIVELYIYPPASGWVSRSKWHSSQEISRAQSGIMKLTMTCPITDTLVRWILQMGECVKIVNPKKLRTLVVEKAKSVVERNSG